MLHRDISVNNIMIIEIQCGDDSNPTIRRLAVLCDWDLCKYKEQMNVVQRTPDRTVCIFSPLFRGNWLTCFRERGLSDRHYH